MEQVCGFLNVLKPPGMSSHDVVQNVRRLYKMRRIGHTGTLDPAAAGVLVLALGPATRLADLLEAEEKAYRAEITLGLVTDTGDAQGNIISRATAAHIREAELEEALCAFKGKIAMRPPAYSAVHVHGRRLYEWTRRGEIIEAPLRDVFVRDIQLLGFSAGERARVLVDIVCSKGTYIRSLAEMLGERLGCGAYLSMLLRTRVGSHHIAGALTLEELATNPQAHVLSIPEALPHLPHLVVGAEAATRLRQGGNWPLAQEMPTGWALVLDEEKNVICLAEVQQRGKTYLQPRRVLAGAS